MYNSVRVAEIPFESQNILHFFSPTDEDLVFPPELNCSEYLGFDHHIAAPELSHVKQITCQDYICRNKNIFFRFFRKLGEPQR